MFHRSMNEINKDTKGRLAIPVRDRSVFSVRGKIERWN